MKLLPIALLGMTLAAPVTAENAGTPAISASAEITEANSAVSAEPAGIVAGTTGATEAALPEAFAGVEGLDYEGEIAGMQAWINPTSNLLWMVDPDTGVTHIGFAYGPDGASLHPQISGPAATLQGLVEGLKAQQARAADGIQVPAAFEGDINAALARLDEAGRAKAISRLTELLANIPKTDEAAYQTAIETWLAEVNAAIEKAEASPAAEDAVKAETPETAALPPLSEALGGAYGLAIGPEDRPVIHVLLDPSCEGCKALLRDFAPKAKAGEIRLNVVMVAAAGPDSFGVISGILTSEDPVATLLASASETDPAKPFARVADLSEEAQAGIRANGDLVLRYGVPSVPFAVIRTEKGEVLIDGIPSMDQISGALPQ